MTALADHVYVTGMFTVMMLFLAGANETFQHHHESGQGTYANHYTASIPANTNTTHDESTRTLGGCYRFGSLSGPAGWVADHNYYRIKHSASLVKWDADLAAKAQAWANHLKQTGSFYHSNSYNVWPYSGENLAKGYGNYFRCGDYSGPYGQACVVYLWWKEYGDCWNCRGRWQDATGVLGHFTAMVWKGIDRIGCGSAGPIYVCEYGSVYCKTRNVQNGGYGCWGTTPPHLPNFNSGSCYNSKCVGCLNYNNPCLPAGRPWSSVAVINATFQI